MSNLKTVPPGGGTATLTKTFITASQDKKSLPTQVRGRAWAARAACSLVCARVAQGPLEARPASSLTARARAGACAAKQHQLQQPALRLWLDQIRPDRANRVRACAAESGAPRSAVLPARTPAGREASHRGCLLRATETGMSSDSLTRSTRLTRPSSQGDSSTTPWSLCITTESALPRWCDCCSAASSCSECIRLAARRRCKRLRCRRARTRQALQA